MRDVVRVLCVSDRAAAAVASSLGCAFAYCRDAVTALAVASAFHPDVCVIGGGVGGLDGLDLGPWVAAQTNGYCLTVPPSCPSDAVAKGERRPAPDRRTSGRSGDSKCDTEACSKV
jgi:hypothetical protein